MTLELERIEKHCRNHPKVREWIHDIFLFDRVDSTNRLALEMASQGLPGGIAIVAEGQEKGRGRLGREWFSPEGVNLYFSLLLRPHQSIRDFPLFSLATAVALVDAIRKATGLNPRIKWPNDILLNDRKVAGILSESEVRGEQTSPLVVGVGVNVNIDASGFPPEIREIATSLKMVLGQPVERTDLLIDIFNALAEEYSLLDNRTELIRRVKERCQTVGERVRIVSGKQTFEGWAEGIQEDGALLIRMGDGSRRKIVMGDVTHLREVKNLSGGVERSALG
ncbi:MAG: biotin--[acetyl-CoA-carboxylase] ligase [Candidatus Manganitrophaceae bacterium]